MDSKYHQYKIRCIFGGNDIRDEKNGILAVFQEQSASASSMVSAKTLEALAHTHTRLIILVHVHAVNVYVQFFLADFEDDIETRVELPDDRWPNDCFWDGAARTETTCVRPGVRLLRNLRSLFRRLMVGTILPPPYPCDRFPKGLRLGVPLLSSN